MELGFVSNKLEKIGWGLIGKKHEIIVFHIMVLIVAKYKKYTCPGLYWTMHVYMQSSTGGPDGELELRNTNWKDDLGGSWEMRWLRGGRGWRRGIQVEDLQSSGRICGETEEESTSN